MRFKNLAAWTFTLALSVALATGYSKTQNASNRSDSQVATDVQTKINGDANSQGAGRMNAYKSMHFVERGTLADFAGDAKVETWPNPFKLSQAGSEERSILEGLSNHVAARGFDYIYMRFSFDDGEADPRSSRFRRITATSSVTSTGSSTPGT